MNTVEHRVGRRDVSQRVVQAKRLAIQPARLVGKLEQRLDLRCESQFAVDFGPEQRFLASAIAREHESAPRLIPDREAEHPLEPGHGIRAEPLVVGDDRLDVAVRAEGITPCGRFPSQLGSIVDLAVADHPDLAVGTLKRLVAGREIHDGEPACPDARALVTDDAFAVGAAVAQRRGHPRERLGMPQRRFTPRYRTEDAAHGP